MVNKITPISYIVDFKGSRKQIKEYITKRNKVKNISFAEILADAKSKLKTC